jgi:hypothetical protein
VGLGLGGDFVVCFVSVFLSVFLNCLLVCGFWTGYFYRDYQGNGRSLDVLISGIT